MSRYIIIEGGIGAGKSTLLKKLKNIYSEACFIGEYIDEPAGQTMFNLFRSGKIDPDTFQEYILDYWKRKLEYHEDGLYFMERGPLAGLAFVNRLNMRNYDEFEADVLKVMDNNNLNQFKFISMEAMLPISAYTTVINNYKGNLIIFLEGGDDTLLKNVKRRRREGEEGYSKEFLRANQDALRNLYTIYKDDLNIELINSN